MVADGCGLRSRRTLVPLAREETDDDASDRRAVIGSCTDEADQAR